MFCDACGAEMQTGQSFCSRCGKQVIATSFAQPLRSRVQEHVRLLGILWLALGAWYVLGGCILLILCNTLFPRIGAPPFLRPLLTFIAFLILIKACVGFMTGWGLLQHESWARMTALILAFISLFNVPFGTALGVYTLWVLLPTRSEEEYEALAQTAPARV